MTQEDRTKLIRAALAKGWTVKAWHTNNKGETR